MSDSTKQIATYVTQSRFFSTSFNAAIFDGPIRIYFAQYQESQALKLYHNLQERYQDVRKSARGLFKERGTSIFVMLYPSEEIFDQSFASDENDGLLLGQGAGAETGPALSQTIVCDRLGADYILGVRGPIMDEAFEVLCQEMDQIVKSA